MPKKAITLYPRKHKGMIFQPYQTGNKRELKSILVKRQPIYHGNQYMGKGRIADKFYFRIFKHKNQPWTLYIGEPKQSHGGLRVKPSGRKRTVEKISSKETKSPNSSRKTGKTTKKKGKTKVEDIRDQYKRIETGPHSGKYKNVKDGSIKTENQLRIIMANRGANK